jgi:hypothetical protein
MSRRCTPDSVTGLNRRCDSGRLLIIDLKFNGSAVWVSSFTVNKVKYMISTLIKLFTEDFYERRKVVNELPIQPVIPSLQQDDSDLLFHECPNCNCRCNCTDQPCSCCNEV